MARPERGVRSEAALYVRLLLLALFGLLTVGWLIFGDPASVWALVALAVVPAYLWWTHSVTVSDEHLTIVNAFRELVIPLEQVIRLEPVSPPGDERVPPYVAVTQYGKFTVARLAYGKDPGTRDEEVVEAIESAIARVGSPADGPAARWRRRSFGVLDWVVLACAVIGFFGQLWLLAST